MVLEANKMDGDVRINYKDQSDFENIARRFGIFQEWKVIQLIFFLTSKREGILIHNFFSHFQDGVPRTAYKGVVVFRYPTARRIFLVGPESLKLLQIEDS